MEKRINKHTDNGRLPQPHLNPCPFCGHKSPKMWTTDLYNRINKLHYKGCWDVEITCEGCGIGFQAAWNDSGVGIDSAESYAAECWNRRA